MIDLHIHTTYSDGTYSLKQVLKLANENEIDCISVTDHNTCDAYFELEKEEVRNLYNGKIITGIEINTSVLDIPIEVLVYDFDYKKMQKLMKRIYPTRKSRNLLEIEVLRNACIENKINIPEDFLTNYDYENYASDYLIKVFKKYNLNKDFEIVDEESYDNSSIFYRKYISNPESIFYIKPDLCVYNLKKLVNELRKIGGKIFIAHIYEYKGNVDNILQYCLESKLIDGFECFHSSFSEEQINYLIKVCKEHNLLISGGSDFHGLKKRNYILGEVSNGKQIPSDILINWVNKKTN